MGEEANGALFSSVGKNWRDCLEITTWLCGMYAK